ncbi:hypothetical protein Tco_0231056 [Tanacetum coccineum]
MATSTTEAEYVAAEAALNLDKEQDMPAVTSIGLQIGSVEGTRGHGDELETMGEAGLGFGGKGVRVPLWLQV